MRALGSCDTNERWCLLTRPASLFSSAEYSGVIQTAWVFNSKAIAAHERAQETGEATSRTAGVFSIARRNLNHQVETIRRKVLAGISARFKTIRPKPPPCNNRSTALKACSRLLLQRTHNNRSNFTPASAAEVTSNVLLQSISAQVSSVDVAPASVANIRLVGPHDSAP